jgi:hypothetical protein
VGDEIVSGIEEDDYSHFVGVALRRQYGVTVTQVMKIENDADVIAFMVHVSYSSYDMFPPPSYR